MNWKIDTIACLRTDNCITMMEETSDEQPEIVTHEEVALAEKEAAEGSTGNQLVVYFVDDR